MAEIGRFFDGPAYGAQAHAEFYTNFLSTGFFWGLDITANNTLEITVASGAAFLEGHEYRNTESLNLEHNIADSANDRIDRIVIRLDNTPEAERPLRALIRSGMPSGEPEPPELIRNDAVYEISLAQVLVEAGKSFIEDYQITDERGDIYLCGRVSQPSVLTDQVGDIDVKRPTTRASQYVRGHSIFYVHGVNNAEIMQEWIDSVGFNPASVGRDLSNIRAYVETNAQRNDTGIQTITIFDWSQQLDYRIYGKFTRTSNSSLQAPTDWGSWNEESLVLEEGENANGRYVRYTNGWQECYWEREISGTTNSHGAIYRSAGIEWIFPQTFSTERPSSASVVTSGGSRWGDVSSTPASDELYFRVFSAVQLDEPVTVLLKAEGRWRP